MSAVKSPKSRFNSTAERIVTVDLIHRVNNRMMQKSSGTTVATRSFMIDVDKIKRDKMPSREKIAEAGAQALRKMRSSQKADTPEKA